jgi:hypothetical protein
MLEICNSFSSNGSMKMYLSEVSPNGGWEEFVRLYHASAIKKGVSGRNDHHHLTQGNT